MSMYNLLEYSSIYSKTSASLWNYYRDDLTDETNDNNGLNKNVINSKSFKYKTRVILEVLITWQLLLKATIQIKKAQKSCNSCAIKMSKQSFENTRYTINQL